jgi:hypothetical protein
LRKVLILGGYGNFGKRIARALTKKGISVIIAGRQRQKAEKLVSELPQGLAEIAVFDVTTSLATALLQLKPAVVIYTCGPFQIQNYAVARECIAQGIHYIDLADGREFVTGIVALDAEARANNVAVISGASTVPGLSSAVVEQYRKAFSVIDSMVFGISPGQKAERGLATTQGILTYVGKPLKPFAGATKKTVYGWQDLYRQTYPELGTRWMANCDIPDLDLLPAHYGIGRIRFSAGLELGILHLGLWALSWVVRVGAPVSLPRYANALLAASNAFDRFGTAEGGMHVMLAGKDLQGRPLQKSWFIIARNGDGPQIPTIPAIILSEKLVKETLDVRGAMPCVGLVTLEEYLSALKDFAVKTYAE